MGGERRRERKSFLRIGVHHADAVVWGPVRDRTRLMCFCFASSISAAFAAAAFACTVATANEAAATAMRPSRSLCRFCRRSSIYCCTSSSDPVDFGVTFLI